MRVVVVAALLAHVAHLAPAGATEASVEPLAAEAQELWAERPPGADALTVVELDAEGRPFATEVDGVARPEDVQAVLAAAPDLVEWSVEVVPFEDLGPAPQAFDPRRAEQWGLDAVGADAAWTTADGAGVVVAVIDSGVQLGHPDLAARLLPGIDVVDGDGRPDDVDGHGTHVAGIVAAVRGNGIGGTGAAPGAGILPVRVLRRNLDGTTSGSTTDLVNGIRAAVDAGADVLNLSLGYKSSTAPVAVSEAIAYAVARDVVVVAAAGNYGVGSLPVWPAADPDVLAVASVDRGLAVSSFSSRGAYVDVAAPGGAVLSTAVGGGYETRSGTSMAAPHAAAAAALLRQRYPSWTQAQVRAALIGTATDLEPAGVDTASGAGLVSFPRAFASGGAALPAARSEGPRLAERDSVRRLYGAFFLRLPDADGLAFWEDAYLTCAFPLARIADEFARSAEFRARYGSLSNRQFVELVYANVLGRAGEAAGVNHWTTQLDAGGLSRGGVMVGFSESAEYVGRTGTTSPQPSLCVERAVSDSVFRLYRAYFLRAPDTGGERYWVDTYGRCRASLAVVSDGFASSAEFRSRYGGLTNRQFVELVYTNVLGRPGEPSGVSYWTTTLDLGVRSRGGVMIGFSESAEFVVRTVTASPVAPGC